MLLNMKILFIDKQNTCFWTDFICQR